MGFTLSIINISCERDERLLFEGVNAEFHSGDIVQLAGPNGSGKTTLAKIIIGIVPHSNGSIEWRASSATVECPTLRESLLYLGHQPAVKSSLTALENLQWYFGLNGAKAPSASPQAFERSLFEGALEAVGLAGYEDVACYQMSAGQQRRVALARLYLSQAPIWILDEPFTAIDTKGVTALELCIQTHAKRGGLVLLTTHQTLSIEGVKPLNIADYLPTSEQRSFYD